MRNLFTVASIMIALTAQPAYAHAVVTHNSLKLNPVPVNRPSQVELSFNAKIELDLSEIFLVSAGDKMQPVTAHSGSLPGQILLDIPALQPGEYALKLKIFAADGHLSEDLLRFFVSRQDK